MSMINTVIKLNLVMGAIFLAITGLVCFFFSTTYAVFVWIIAVILLILAFPKVKKCPKCAETVKPEAKVCRYCGFNFELDNLRQRVIQDAEAEKVKTVKNLNGS